MALYEVGFTCLSLIIKYLSNRLHRVKLQREIVNILRGLISIRWPLIQQISIDVSGQKEHTS